MNRIAWLAIAPTIAFAGPACAQDIRPSAPYVFERGYPTPDTGQQARDDADFERAVTAYRFWYPAVSVEGIFEGNRDAGIEDNKAMGIAAAGPRQVGFTSPSIPTRPTAWLRLRGGSGTQYIRSSFRLLDQNKP